MKRYNSLAVVEIVQTAKNKSEAAKEVRRLIAGIKPATPTTFIKVRVVSTIKLLF